MEDVETGCGCLFVGLFDLRCLPPILAQLRVRDALLSDDTGLNDILFFHCDCNVHHVLKHVIWPL